MNNKNPEEEIEPHTKQDIKIEESDEFLIEEKPETFIRKHRNKNKNKNGRQDDSGVKDNKKNQISLNGQKVLDAISQYKHILETSTPDRVDRAQQKINKLLDEVADKLTKHDRETIKDKVKHRYFYQQTFKF